MNKKGQREVDDEESLFCRSLIPRLKRRSERKKSYLRIQIEQLLFNLEFIDPHIDTSQVPTTQNFRFTRQPNYYSQSPNANSGMENISFQNSQHQHSVPQPVIPTGQQDGQIITRSHAQESSRLACIERKR